MCILIIEPAKVSNVTVVPVMHSDVQKDYINQAIMWERPENHSHITHYLIQYGVCNTSRENRSTVSSTTTSTVLMLPIPTNATTYSVWVAAVSVAGQGEFSDRQEFSYSSKLNRLHTVSIVFV